MKKIYEYWGLYDYEKQVKKDSFIAFLEYVFENDSMNKVIEILKASGYFISYSDNVVIGEKQKEKIDNFVNSYFKKNGIKKYENLKIEAYFLSEKRNDIESKILDILKQYEISYENLIYFILWEFNNISKNNQLCNEQKVSTQEYCIYILGFLLKIKMHMGSNEFKEKKVASDKELCQLFNYTFIYREMNEIIQSWMFGEVKIERDGTLEIEELPGNNEDRVISASNYWDIKDIKDIKAYFIEFEKTGNWQDNLDVYDIRLKEKVKEDFYSQNFQEKYLEIPLFKWMEVYKIFADKAFKASEPILKLQRDLFLKEISATGLSVVQAKEVLKHLVFGKSSKDLFDSFLIEQDGELLFIPKMYLFVDHSKAMISLFGKAQENDANVEQKGRAFEHHLYLLMKKSIKCIEHNISMNYRDEEFELDLAFILNNDLFICECKTQYQHEDMRGYYRNLKELDVYLKKFERNYKFFTEQDEGKRMLSQRLNVQFYNNIYPIFISNIVFIEPQINNIYITDETRIYRYMKRIPANIGITNPKEKIQTYFRLFPQYYEGKVTATQFIEYLNNKSNELEVERKKVVLAENYTLKEFNIKSKRYMENKQLLKSYLNYKGSQCEY